MLVWSEAWTAEGEKGKTDCYPEYTPAGGHLGAVQPFMMFKNSRMERTGLYLPATRAGSSV
jgi:hypothetical protein